MADETTINVPQAGKSNDLIATVIGIGQAMAVSLMNYIAHVNETGGIVYNASFWIGIAIAMLAGLQGYYSNRGGTSTQVTASPTGRNATVNVAVDSEPQKPA